MSDTLESSKHLGGFLLWYQTLEVLKQESKHIIFVSVIFKGSREFN